MTVIIFAYSELRQAVDFIEYALNNGVNISSLKNDDSNYYLNIESSSLERLSIYMVSDCKASDLGRIIKNLLPQ